MSTCGRCGKDALPNQSYVLYHEAGGRAAGSDKRIVVHGECIAEDVAAGRITRVSGFSFEYASGGCDGCDDGASQ